MSVATELWARYSAFGRAPEQFTKGYEEDFSEWMRDIMGMGDAQAKGVLYNLYKENGLEPRKPIEPVSKGCMTQPLYNLMTDPKPAPWKLGFTGHRDTPKSGNFAKAMGTLLNVLSQTNDNIDFHHGGARGADLTAAETALWNGKNIHTHLPFPEDVTTKGWNFDDKVRLSNIINQSKSVTIERQTYNPAGYFERNQRILDNSELLSAQYDGRTGGGTYDTIKKANASGLPVIDPNNFGEINIAQPKNT